MINYYNSTGATFGSWGAFDRGYTGHEHLISVGLINMNARLYDPKLHRFLQPDNYVQEPFNTQNYNRYGYCWNNPLRFSDLTGNFTWSDLIASVSIVVGVAMVIVSGGTLTPVAQGFIGAGVAHFGATFAMYMNNKAAGWDNASNYIGFKSPTININTGWGDSRNDKNGVTQTAPVVKPETIAKDDVRNMRNDGGNKGDNSFHPGQYFPNFKADVGPDIFKFKGLHFGVPEFESSLMTDAAFTPGPFVIYPTGRSSDKSLNTHEGGHVLQFALMGGLYYPFIALPSMLHVNDPNTDNHYHEKTANQLWYWWSGESYSTNPLYTRKKL